MGSIASLRLAFPLPLPVLLSALLLLVAACAGQQGASPSHRGDTPAPPLHEPPGASAGPGARTGGERAVRPPQGAPPRPEALPGDTPFRDAHLLAPYLEGTASWYGPRFHGRRTASGETYNQYGLTAAHPVLPMGTKIEVENLANGRRVWVRINDRGPYKKGRVLDLSRTAAEHLGMISPGTAPVRITVLRWPQDIQPELGLRAYQQYVVQVGAFPAPDEAERRRRHLERRFPWASFRLDRPPRRQRTAVVAGPYDSDRTARRTASRLQQAGVTCLVRTYRK